MTIFQQRNTQKIISECAIIHINVFNITNIRIHEMTHAMTQNCLKGPGNLKPKIDTV